MGDTGDTGTAGSGRSKVTEGDRVDVMCHQRSKNKELTWVTLRGQAEGHRDRGMAAVGDIMARWWHQGQAVVTRPGGGTRERWGRTEGVSPHGVPVSVSVPVFYCPLSPCPPQASCVPVSFCPTCPHVSMFVTTSLCPRVPLCVRILPRPHMCPLCHVPCPCVSPSSHVSPCPHCPLSFPCLSVPVSHVRPLFLCSPLCLCPPYPPMSSLSPNVPLCPLCPLPRDEPLLSRVPAPSGFLGTGQARVPLTLTQSHPRGPHVSSGGRVWPRGRQSGDRTRPELAQSRTGTVMRGRADGVGTLGTLEWEQGPWGWGHRGGP